ncbi:MAG: ferritin-like protein [Myxococcota bacterium]
MTQTPLEPEIVVNSREELIFLLQEAAEIEHGLMCTYLYASWSLKGADDGLSSAQAEAVERWRKAIVSVAVDEMLHLAVVSNLLTAVGAGPHLSRQNLPVTPGYHPGALVVKLAAFNESTIDHFVYLERPEGVELPDGAEFVHGTWVRPSLSRDTWMPTAQDYLTVGHFYRSLRAAFTRLANRLGEQALFCGDPARQVGPGILDWDGLEPVVDVVSAHRAIDLIVEQGEGSPGHVENSHYARFCTIQEERKALQQADPRFEPAHRCATNPVQKRPPKPEGRVHIVHPPAAQLLDLGNATYNLMLRTLAQGLGADASIEARRGYIDAAIDGMKLLDRIGRQLARMPADPERHPGIHAGLSFAVTRGQAFLPEAGAAKRLLSERYRELASAFRQVEGQLGGVEMVATQLAELGAGLPTV